MEEQLFEFDDEANRANLIPPTRYMVIATDSAAKLNQNVHNALQNRWQLAGGVNIVSWSVKNANGDMEAKFAYSQAIYWP